MIVRIRTNDDLKQLLKQGFSDSWRISKNRLNDIKKVEIYNFEGTQCLKGDFSLSNSKWVKDDKDNDRLVVAFTNATIEKANYKWVGQNPIKYVEDTGEEQQEEDNDEAVVMVLAGEHGERIALKYNVYKCQNKRSFRECEYLAFYNAGEIKHLFKIIDGPYDDVEISHPVIQEMIKNQDVEVSEQRELARLFHLKYDRAIGPIANDSIGKNGKSVPFTYGQPRYTTLGRIKKAKKTSELVKEKEEVIVLEGKGENTLINPNGATIKLKWSTVEDFDIAALCKSKQGELTLVYFGNKGSLEKYPFMKLDQDEMGGEREKMETILINNLDNVEKVAIIAWDYSNRGNKANFDISDVVVAVEDETGFEATAKLVVTQKSDSVCVASIENTKEGFVFENISKNFMYDSNLPDMWKNVFS